MKWLSKSKDLQKTTTILTKYKTPKNKSYAEIKWILKEIWKHESDSSRETNSKTIFLPSFIIRV